MHFYDCGRACLHRSFFVGWQNIHSGGGIVYFGNLVLADTQSFNEDFALFVCFKGDIIAVCSGNAESKAFHFSVGRCFHDFQVPTHRFICKTFALCIFDLIGLSVGVNKHFIHAFVQREALRCFCLFHKIASIEQIVHFILSDFLFGQRTDQLVLTVKLAVVIGILVDFKNSACQFGICIFSVHLCQSDISTDKLIDDFNLNNLPVFRNVYIIDGFIKHESGRLFDFTDIPVSVRHILKGEAAIVAGYGGHQGIFFGKIHIIALKQTNERTAKSFAVFVNLLT